MAWTLLPDGSTRLGAEWRAVVLYCSACNLVALLALREALLEHTFAAAIAHLSFSYTASGLGLTPC